MVTHGRSAAAAGRPSRRLATVSAAPGRWSRLACPGPAWRRIRPAQKRRRTGRRAPSTPPPPTSLMLSVRTAQGRRTRHHPGRALRPDSPDRFGAVQSPLLGACGVGGLPAPALRRWAQPACPPTCRARPRSSGPPTWFAARMAVRRGSGTARAAGTGALTSTTYSPRRPPAPRAPVTGREGSQGPSPAARRAGRWRCGPARRHARGRGGRTHLPGGIRRRRRDG